MIKVQRISMNDPLYEQACALRERALLEQVGLTMAKFKAAFPGVEERFEHFVAVFDHPNGPRVVGCASLLCDEPEKGVGKLMQMAVDPQRQGEGIGRKLVVAVEARAFGTLKLTDLVCHARGEAIDFYQALGWNPIGDRFDEVGIEHQKMGINAGVLEPGIS